MCNNHAKLIFSYTMLYWIIQTTLISIIFICVLHFLIDFYTSVLTVPKVKDLVNNPAKKYETIYNIIANNPPSEYNPPTSEYNPSKDDMKNELKNFLKQQLNVSSSTDISTLGTYL